MDDLTLSAARTGDRNAQARLLRELQDPWHRLCLALLRDGDKVRDATQETALRFLRELPRFRGQSQLRTWAMGIAINVVREIRRQRRPVSGLDELDAIDPTASVYPPPDQAVADAERVRQLHENLSQLPERQREAVVLRFFEELSTEQTAAVMNCAQGTVKATLHQALRSLRQKLTMMVLL